MGKSCRTLHKGGECHRIPGVQYENFVACGAALPKSDSYSRVCRDCFPQGLCRDLEGLGNDTGLVRTDIIGATKSDRILRLCSGI